MDSHTHPRKQTAQGKEATGRVLFSNEDTDFLVVWRMDRRPHGLLRYLVRPRTCQRVGELMEVDMLPSRAPRPAHLRLAEEARLVSLLAHPAIARVYGLHESEGKAFLLKEHVEGCNLDTIINLGLLRGRRMSESFSLYVASEVAGALHCAHTARDEEGRALGLLHRSVNPGCIRVGRNGGVKLTDFASAYSLLPGRLRTPKGLVRGEIDYAAPERLLRRDKGVVDARADIFSLGVVLLELLTGSSLYDLEAVEQAAREARRTLKTRAGASSELPSWAPVGEMARLAASFHPEHVEAAMRDVSAPVRALLHQALRRDPAERYATAAEFQADLQACLRAPRRKPYGPEQAARELLVARTEAEASPERENAGLLEWGIFPEDVPRHS
ncbi:serine/threonine-protein kinase [Archangium sp.]|jgi:serine/threonine-protein kinase|uniref:serine/threonine protein kinase n=1 Tax=Archangium sp. TaxID=1872627 RepID=UPI002ED8B844